MKGIFDIDSLVYEACYSAEDFDEASESFWARYSDVEYHLERRYGEGNVDIIPVGFCTNNYRHKVDKNYKANRRGSDKPQYFAEIIEHIKDNLEVQSRSGMETDDLVAKFLHYYGKDNCVIISIDKDYAQFNCTIFNYRKRSFINVSKEEALYNIYAQAVTGDRADNVLVCKGYGEKWCEKNLRGKNEFAMMRTVFTLYSKLYKGKAREKMIKTFMLLKLNIF
tara:strand:+ start:133 stop:801 length:669 start_codon:yes stop_codon:yes gene_type:complete